MKLAGAGLAFGLLALLGAVGSAAAALLRRRLLTALKLSMGGCAVAVAASVGGSALGAVQVVRGLVSTPAAARGWSRQQVWDNSRGAWVDIDLSALERELEQADELEASAAVADTEFYDLLQVAPAASAQEVKKAYYREARKCHPDTNPGDEGATARFQSLAEAYKVLSDPELRQRYDADGKVALEGSGVLGKMDPTLFFGLLFGYDSFEPWVGELDLAMRTGQMAKSGAARSRPPSGSRQDLMSALQRQMQGAGRMRRRQARREVGCAAHLRQKLDEWTAEGAGAWEAALRAEAARLASSQRGPELLTALGDVYSCSAKVLSGSAFSPGVSASRAARALRQLRRQCRAAGDVVRSLFTVQRGLRRAARQRDRVGAKAAVEEALPLLLSFAWRSVIADVDRTAGSVARLVLCDKSVAPEARQRRAAALLSLGHIFHEEGRRAARSRGGDDEADAPEAVQASIRDALAASVGRAPRPGGAEAAGARARRAD